MKSGHGDFDPRLAYHSPYFNHGFDLPSFLGWTKTADGIAEVQKAARENLRAGATQLKIMGSGSITGAHDPLDGMCYCAKQGRFENAKKALLDNLLAFFLYFFLSLTHAFPFTINSTKLRNTL